MKSHTLLLEVDDIAAVQYLIKGFPDSSVGKESACNAGGPGSTPGLGRFHGGWIGYPLQYSGQESDTTERLSVSNYFICLKFSFVIFKYNIINWRFLISFKKTVAFKQEFPLTNGLFL